MDTDDTLRRLAAARFGTAEVMAAAGTPAARFQQRFKETEGLPLSDVALDPIPKRRSYLLGDAYNLRLLEVLSAPSRLGVRTGAEIIKRLAGFDVDGNHFNADGSPADPEETSAFRAMRESPPEYWPDAWRSRDLSAPWWVVAREYAFGWRTATHTDAQVALLMLLRPEDVPPGGSFTVIFNLTEELARVDAVLTGSMEAA